MDYSIKELRQKTKEIIDLVEDGKTITITYRGKKKAKVIPMSKQVPKTKVGFGMWADNSLVSDSCKYVEKLRRGRHR